MRSERPLWSQPSIILFVWGLLFGAAIPVADAAPTPFGTWNLRHTIERGEKSVPIAGSRITLTLERQDRCSGNSGVNQYFGECRIYERNRRIRFPGSLGSTKRGGPRDWLRQEAQYKENLTRSTRFRVRNQRLRLISSDRQIKSIFRKQR